MILLIFIIRLIYYAHEILKIIYGHSNTNILKQVYLIKINQVILTIIYKQHFTI